MMLDLILLGLYFVSLAGLAAAVYFQPPTRVYIVLVYLNVLLTGAMLGSMLP